MIRTNIEASELMLVQANLTEAYRVFRAHGRDGLAEMARTYIRDLVDNGSGLVSTEILYANRKLSKEARELGRPEEWR